jgi:hypothetical protein
MKIKGQSDVPIIHIGEDLALREMEEKAVELHISIEGLYMF